MPVPNLFRSPTTLKIAPTKFQVGAQLAAAPGALANHVAALQSQGIDDLAVLGKLPISGIVIPQAGILRPRVNLVAPADFVDRTAMFQGVMHARLNGGAPVAPGAELLIDRVGGTANVLKAEPLRRQVPISQPSGVVRMAFALSPAANILDIPIAYWAADEITIADDTMIVLKQPNHWLVIIANKITIGANVSVVWEQITKAVPAQASARPKPATPSQSSTMGGTNGADGSNGAQGAKGPDGDAGPEIELWTLDINRLPAEVLVNGQDGVQGGKGQNGQPGQNGARGRDWRMGTLGTCASGPGDGGDGGDGGNGGRGGAGGAGGRGGRFNVFAPAEVLGIVSAQGFYMQAEGGTGGPAGKGGQGGAGGSGGRPGDQRTPPCPTDFNHHGKDGSNGSAGGDGVAGKTGDHLPNATALTPIKKKDFDQAFNRPAIYNLSADKARVGDTLTAVGKRFADTDSVYVGDAKAVTTFVSDTLLQFVVPTTEGGRQRPVYVKQVDNTRSNNATLQILPVVLWLEQDGKRSNSNPPTRLSPGKRVTIVGTGLSASPTVLVNDQNAPDADVKFESSERISFTLFRPHNVKRVAGARPDDPDTESVEIRVRLRDDAISSEPVAVELDTVAMAVFGDSIAWGQGLREDLKYYYLVAQHIGQFSDSTVHGGNGTIGVYWRRGVKAHSGAIIGVGDNHTEKAVDGEVPTSYPTILQQVDAYNGNPALVDVVLLDGGINDIGVEAIISPLADGNLPGLIQQRCYSDMKQLLKKVTQRFPNAKVVVTGYFPIVTDQSSLLQLYAYLMAMGMLLGGPVAAAVVGAVTAAQKDTMVSHCKTFAEQANAKLAQAVNDAKAENAAAGQNARIAFAKPDFGAQNALFCGDTSWLWGLELDAGPADDVELGGVEVDRAQACSIVENDDPSRTLEIKCVRASVGHPNRAGAAEYARAIKAVL